MKKLIAKLNEASVAYYQDNNPIMSDKDFDDWFDELKSLEDKTGIIYSNSPTQNVGCEVVSSLQKVRHTHPMLSLSKTKSIEDLINFINGKDYVLSLKMDGLTVCLTYDKGKLIRAETRGDGTIGEIITHNAKVFDNVPLTVENKNYFEIEGEAIITIQDFERINAALPNDQKYKNPRNLASGSVRQLDSNIAAQRHLKFVAWKVPQEPDYMAAALQDASELGFTVVPYIYHSKQSKRDINQEIEILKQAAVKNGYPIDGLVMSYNDVEYGKSLGMTGHHPKHSIAYKFYEDEAVTKLRNIEWSMGKTGQLTPVAIFDPVDLEGTSVSRASIHNVSIFNSLKLGIGDEITVYKANQIIPQIRENLTQSNTLLIPNKCPVCGHLTEIQKDNDSEVLICTNPYCKTKLVKRLVHFVSRKGMNIDGLSEETLSKFVDLGWIKTLYDVYNLRQYYSILKDMPGFGVKSVKKLQESIENSKNVELDHFITALSIPGIGSSQAKVLSDFFRTWDCFCDAGLSKYRFDMMIDGIGEVLNNNIHEWFQTIYQSDLIPQLVRNLNFIDESISDKTKSSVDLSGKVFVITGTLNHYSNRDELKKELESHGAKVSGSVSLKTTMLINNDINSNSSKNKKAKELNIPIVNEEYIIEMLKESGD